MSLDALGEGVVSPYRSIDTATLVGAAFDVLDDAGIDGFTVQAVADRLGTAGSSLGGQAGSARHLLDMLAADMWNRIHDVVDAASDGHSWHRDLATFARVLRRTVLHHRDGARVLAGATTSGAIRPPQAWQVMTRLVDQGVTWAAATRAYSVVYHVTVGFCIEQQAAAVPVPPGSHRSTRPRPMWDAIVTHPHVLQPERADSADPDVAFEDILDQVLHVVTEVVRA